MDRVGAVARALTGTTGGVSELQREVVCTAASIAGTGALAAMTLRDGEDVAVVVDPHVSGPDAFAEWDLVADVGAGQRVRRMIPDRGSLLVLPMWYRDAVVGALAVLSPPGVAALDADAEGVLAILANNAAIAMENARLYEFSSGSWRAVCASSTR